MSNTSGHPLVPKLWETLPRYTRQRFVADLIAGLTVCGAQPQPYELFQRSKLIKLLGRRNTQPHSDVALERAAIIHGGFDNPRARIPA